MAQQPGPRPSRGRRTAVLVAHLVVLYAFWLGLSGRTNPLDLVLGLAAVALVVALTHSLVSPDSIFQDAFGRAAHRERFSLRRFLAYLPWMLLQIIKANLTVAYLVLHPRKPVDPVLLEFYTPLRGEASQVLLAHSITLTPGTVTIDARDGRFLVHAITPDAAESLLQGDMQQRVERVFGLEPRQPAGPYITRDPKEIHI